MTALHYDTEEKNNGNTRAGLGSGSLNHRCTGANNEGTRLDMFSDGGSTDTETCLPSTPLMAKYEPPPGQGATGETHIRMPIRSRNKPDPFVRKPLWTITDEPDAGIDGPLITDNSLVSDTQCDHGRSSQSLAQDSNQHLHLLKHQNSNYDSCPTTEDFDLLDGERGIISNSASEDHTSTTLLPAEERERDALHRHLSLFDLVCVGIGSTIGSGIFVLCGLIANQFAGPATFLSWGIAGGAACLSGICYAELAGKIPTAGSVYAYSYVAMGELPAVMAGACLTLEYVGSASAVARSWGDKVVEYVYQQWLLNGDETQVQTVHNAEDNKIAWWIMRHILDPGYGISPMAFVVSTASVILLLQGVKESKTATNFFTTFNVSLVTFMGVGGLVLVQKANLLPLVPRHFGFAGIFRGATSSFFGYIGYDEICCIAGEAINPRQNLPRAILLTLCIVTCLYMVAALALTGMQPYQHISCTSGFPNAFRWNGVEWAAQLSAAGEIFALPSVVFITIMAQPRLIYALSKDGLLPTVFSKVDRKGNLRNGAILSGIVMITVSTFIPFSYLDDLISSGILVAFSMTDWSLIALRYNPPPESPSFINQRLAVFNALAFLTGMALTHLGIQSSKIGLAIVLLGGASMVHIARDLTIKCERNRSFGWSTKASSGDSCCNMFGERNTHTKNQESFFETPFMPYLPCLAMFLNWYLITQMEWFGVCLLIVYLSLAAAIYFSYGISHSIGNTKGWTR